MGGPDALTMNRHVPCRKISLLGFSSASSRVRFLCDAVLAAGGEGVRRQRRAAVSMGISRGPLFGAVFFRSGFFAAAFSLGLVAPFRTAAFMKAPWRRPPGRRPGRSC